ncbi:MAG: hypothetical protein ACP5N7_01765 [Candidatus Pacearchaeota archaeon]
MKRLFIFTYPKLTLYVLAIIASYFVFQTQVVQDFISSFGELLYLAIFFAGLLFSAGFSTPLAMGFFLSLDPSNLFLAAIVGGFGALVSDLGLFSFVRLSFMDEFQKLEKTSLMTHIADFFRTIVPYKLRAFLVYVLACFIIASPLPDELAVTLLAGFTNVKGSWFGIISYLGNALGIYLLLLI